MDNVNIKPTGATSVNPVTQPTSAKQQDEKEMMAEFTYNRSITIKTIDNYSAYRQTNISVMGRRISSIGSSIPP